MAYSERLIRQNAALLRASPTKLPELKGEERGMWPFVTGTRGVVVFVTVAGRSARFVTRNCSLSVRFRFYNLVPAPGTQPRPFTMEENSKPG
jgi:hypothetical protein